MVTGKKFKYQLEHLANNKNSICNWTTVNALGIVTNAWTKPQENETVWYVERGLVKI